MATMDAPTSDQSTTSPLPALPTATIPLWELVPAERWDYFNHQPTAQRFNRSYEFGSSPQLLPLVRAFLNTCAADQGEDYQYVFTLLGSELAANALRHSRSGWLQGRYTLTCQRLHSGLHLACTDAGAIDHVTQVDHLTHVPGGLSLEAESGRGLAMIDLLATSWGDNGCSAARQVWFYLGFDLTGGGWSTL